MSQARPLLTRARLVPLALLLLALAAIAAYLHVREQRAGLPEGLLQANGRIEGDHVIVSSKLAGRIASLRVREGDAVACGQQLARLDDAQVKARVAQAVAAVDAIAGQLDAARVNYRVQEQDLPLAIAIAETALASARTQVARAEAAAEQAARSHERTLSLVARGFIDPQRAEQSALALTTARSEQGVAGEALRQARHQLAQARLGSQRLAAQRAQVAALESQERQARAAVDEANSQLRDLDLLAPIKGVVTVRFRQEGEVVGAGAPILDLVDLDALYLTVYLPETAIGKVRLGQEARIYTDAFPDTGFAAVVRMIASRAEFTPREVQTREERTRLTYAVRLYLVDNPDHRLTPGMPADAVIRWKEGLPWMRPRW